MALRLTDQEKAWLIEQAAALDITESELARALVFGRPPERKPVPCSPKHLGCTHHHRNQVDSYNDQLEREKAVLEGLTGMYRGDLEIWRENGGRLTTFQEWLQATRRD